MSAPRRSNRPAPAEAAAGRRRWAPWLAASLMALMAGLPMGAGGCTDAELVPIPPVPQYRDDKLAVRGQLCTRPPETLIFPLRVLFVIDASVSMEITDPPDPVTGETGRERAVRQVWTDLLEQSPEGTRVGIIRFSAQAQSRTSEDLDGDDLEDTFFTANETLLDAGTQALGVTDRTTNYVNALGEAYYEIRTELLRAEQESLPLSKYVVVFLSDGTPDIESMGSRERRNEQILGGVEALRELADDFRVGEFAFHTAFISSGREAFDQDAKQLLEQMAETGGGNFRSFPNGEELNFLFVDLSILKRIFTLKTLSAVNLNTTQDRTQIPERPPPPGQAPDDMGARGTADMGGADMGQENMAQGPAPDPDPRPDGRMFVDLNSTEYIECGEPLVDSDGDGLADITELEVGTDPLVPDSDDDGLLDYIEWQLADSGLDPLDPEDSRCYIPSPCVDEDDDGRCDCLLDFDADGQCDCEDPPVACTGEADDPPDCVDYDPVPPAPCAGDEGQDCIDEDEDGRCDCPDLDEDGRCDYDDRDGDGLSDCEEVFWGSAQNGIDTDADGLPDPSEVRFQTNPAQFDLQEDQDADRTPNGTEVLSNTDPACDDAALRSRTAYRYELRQRDLAGDQTCYDFALSNVTLAPTLQNPGAEGAEHWPGGGWNRILLYAGEVAFDDPRAFASYRVACVMARYNPEGNYKNPPSGRFDLTEADFVPSREFDPEEHCIYPNQRALQGAQDP